MLPHQISCWFFRTGQWSLNKKKSILRPEGHSSVLYAPFPYFINVRHFPDFWLHNLVDSSGQIDFHIKFVKFYKNQKSRKSNISLWFLGRNHEMARVNLTTILNGILVRIRILLETAQWNDRSVGAKHWVEIIPSPSLTEIR